MASADELSELWARYKEYGDEDTKNEILLRHVELVKRIVRRMMPKYSYYNEFDDLVNCGIIGLMGAIEKFDPTQGVNFETYAVNRIRGEILDYMRAQDWAPSSLRKRISQLTAAYEKLEARDGVAPDDKKIAEEMGISESQVRKILSQTHLFNLVKFEDALTGVYSVLNLAGPAEEIPENVLMDKDLKATLAELIDELPEKEKLVITLCYYEGLMLKEIAEILEVSESRVSQIHSKVLAKLRAKLI